ncbi:cold-shock protein [Parafrankia sp. EUN1f]|uniref:cold-shock protein n=1 Tax=Parafrankia sp. EUN1f TaxID=102897 RepID=UPI0001C4469D|nr:cold shock domain-containing protein [Parafrankia sp. EUN1f]EFC84755.1 cold-shock DNA-binding domain protein [Parafrankia sp. EUN1f]
MSTGKVLRFDHVRGYGFIAPSDGGEDVFLHANDLLVEKSLVVPGVVMEFDVEDSDRGRKASSARIVRGSAPGGPSPLAGPGPVSARADDGGDGLCDVLPVEEFTQEVTEVLLQTEPPLTGTQILHVRRQLASFARKYGWVEN